MKQRTLAFALRVMKMVEHLPKSDKSRMGTNQIVRSATSVGANYRAACRGRSKAGFFSKIGIALEEADETGYWLEIIEGDGMLSAPKLGPLRQEADELSAILFTTRESGK